MTLYIIELINGAWIASTIGPVANCPAAVLSAIAKAGGFAEAFCAGGL